MWSPGVDTIVACGGRRTLDSATDPASASCYKRQVRNLQSLIIKFRKLANKFTWTVRRDSTFLDEMKRILNIDIVFEIDYEGMLVATGSMIVMKDILGSDFRIGIIASSYYGYIPVAKVM